MATSCIQCNKLDTDEDFYETHQWLPDRLWCVNKKSRSVDEMTTAIVSKYRAEVKSKYGNKKRHRQ
jgi:hypothetical protein